MNSSKPTRRKAALSPSRIKELRQCPLKFRLHMIDGIQEPPSDAALRGTLVHLVLERLFDLPASERTEEAANNLLGPCWHELCESPRHETDIFESEEAQSQWFESARPLIASYFRLEYPAGLEPVGRERFIEAVLPSGLAIRGIIDRIDQAPTGEVRIVDYKTGKSPNPRFQGEYLFQMRFYAAAMKLARGVVPAQTQLLFLKDARSLTFEPTEETVQSTLIELDEAWEEIAARIESERFLPQESPLCQWCGLQEYCPARGGTPPAIPAEGVEHLKTAMRSTESEGPERL